MFISASTSGSQHRKDAPPANRDSPGGASLVVQQLRLRAPNAGSLGSIPGQGTRSQMLPLRPGAAK